MNVIQLFSLIINRAQDIGIKNSRQTVSILGCGWLGLALGKSLLENGFNVKGSVTRFSGKRILRNSGIRPYRVVLKPERVVVDDPAFFETDVLVISIPPRRVEGIEDIFYFQIRRLIPEIIQNSVQKVIFISSTSVYSNDFRIVREDDVPVPEKNSGKALLLAENLLREQPGFQTTVIRFGGLIGAERNPARFLLKPRQSVAENTLVNLIHRDDCISIIAGIIDRNIWGEVLNACCPVHPTKKEFYEKASLVSGLPTPEFSKKMIGYKVVDSSKLIGLLHYRFKYPSPMDYLNTL